MLKLAILGASYLQEPLVRRANSLGIETHCFAWDNEHAVCKSIAHFFYPISVLEKQQILEKCKDIGVNGITTIATDICVPTISFVAEKMNLISNSLESALKSTNKSLMREAFLKGKVNSPESITLDFYDIKVLKDLKFPLIVKPTDRSGSLGVKKVSNQEELKIAIENGIENSIEKKVVVEEYIEGNEVSVEAISWKGAHHILAITDKITTNAPFFVELEHHQPSQLPIDIQNRIKAETIKALEVLQINFGASHSEFKITADGRVYIIEVGARMGGDFIGSHLVQLSTGYDFVKGVIDSALGNFEEPIITQNAFSGVHFLCKETKKKKKYFEENNSFDVEKKVLHSTLKSVANSNDRSGYLIYKNDKKIILR